MYPWDGVVGTDRVVWCTEKPGNVGIPYVFGNYKIFQLSSGIGFAELVKWHINEWQEQGKQILKIMVAGKVGAGKSALVSSLIGQEVAV